MKYVRLMGGLGNQMFQYAFAKKNAVIHNEKVGLDLSFLYNSHLIPGVTKRDYELDVFSLEVDTVSKTPVFYEKISNSIVSKIIKKICHKFYYYEKSFEYNSSYLENKNWKVAIGYFQTAKYFDDIRSILLKDFSIKNSLSEKSLNVASDIARSQSVSLHVRRGDFVSSAHNLNYHGICGLDYYEKAIDYMYQELASPVFYVFSDDIDWAKLHLKFKGSAVFVSHNSEKYSYEDMLLMSYCNHNIIANSSFSWWGAWLNQFENKIVIAPKNWFKARDIDTSDLIPNEWISM